ncbi:AMP-binding protein [Nitrospirillum sp. BR 11164]|uniref:AMP-binding protein n=1 Tax=Nitrospirillum sp. BR 11164 TaxID=3104324 RepID=UPI002AFFD789|nr:AMP-binding protein [Nitrospirillum sp. BR 11164]MEA1648440.1 AMP-binding protein [Nitrospirillum sp. BR 11164]
MSPDSGWIGKEGGQGAIPDGMMAHAFERARHHPFWRHLYRDCGHWRDAPVCQKGDLLAALDGFSPAREERGIYLVRSGGSAGGGPLIFPVDIAENHAQRQALAEHLLARGVFAPNSVVLNLFAYSGLYRTAAIVDDLLERCYATTVPMSAQSPHSDMLAAAEMFQPTHLAGTPSILTLLANWCEETGKPPPRIPQLLYAGELMRDSVRERLSRIFGIQRIWSLYGAAETGIWAVSDATATPGVFSTLPQIVVEIIAPDASRFGEIVVTNTWRRRFPLFRYSQGDVGRIVTHGGQRMLEVRGRRPRTFRFYEITHDDSGFAAVAEGCAAWQAVLEFGADGCDRLGLHVVCDDPAILPAIAERLRRHMKQDEGGDTTYVRAVTLADLHIDPTTAKTATLVDRRR